MISHPTTLKRSTKPIKRTRLKRSTKPIKRSPLKRKPTKKHGGENEDYLDWLRTCPCFVCLKRFCEQRDWPFDVIASEPMERALVQALDLQHRCGPTEAAHVGIRGLLQRCPDREAMPL
jgi:hypothetical protein